MNIISASAAYERVLRSTIGGFPSWYVSAARVSRIEVSTDPEVLDQIAAYEHGSRRLRVAPKIAPQFLRRALSHELGHGCDDYRDQPHYFSGSDAWIKIHAMQHHFDHPKYGDQALEYFADIFSKVITGNPVSLAATNPYEAQFFSQWVIPTLRKEFK